MRLSRDSISLRGRRVDELEGWDDRKAGLWKVWMFDRRC